MAFLVSKLNIPSVGDLVEKVILSKDKLLAQITFESGKKVVFSVNRDEFRSGASVVSGTNPPEKSISKKQVVTSKKVTEGSTKVNSMSKNSPEDQNYKARVLAKLAQMEGKSPEEIKELLEQTQKGGGATMMNESTPANDDWKERAAAVLEKSQERASRLSEQISRSSGGRTESSFGGKSSIAMK